MSSDPRGYAYDVQYILRGQNLSVEDMRSVIGKMGDSMIVVGDDTQIKVHIHVHNPGEPISYGASLGVISHVIVENMQDQATEYIAVRENNMANTVNEGEIAVITVAPGEGWRRVFQQLGATGVVSGGQSMNPSASDMIEAIKAIKTDKFLLLPNNKNILLTAESAAKIIREQTGQLVKVIPTRSLPQGVAAMLSFAASGEFERVSETMSEASRDVITGEITTASRDASFDGIEIGAGQLIALADGKLVMTSDNLSKIVHDLLEVMKVREHEVVTLYYGQPIQKAEAETVIDELQHSFPRQGFDLVEGGQPNYHFIISVE